jgi:NAD(P)-dependent dehydrogenase (short-subunit alcohol dehydrogenase family)
LEAVSDRSQKTVLTTGSNSGIGLATAVHLARLGFRSVGSVRSEDKAEVLRVAAEEAGVTVETVLLDVTDADRGRQVIDQFRPWGLVNNAGYGGIGAIEDVDDDEARALFETMVVAPMRLARLAAPHMRQSGGGRVVNMSSVFGRTTAPLVGWYSGAKHALEALSDSLRMETASAGIKVVLIEPGGFRTGIWEEVSGQNRAPSWLRLRGGLPALGAGPAPEPGAHGRPNSGGEGGGPIPHLPLPPGAVPGGRRRGGVDPGPAPDANCGSGPFQSAGPGLVAISWSDSKPGGGRRGYLLSG